MTKVLEVQLQQFSIMYAWLVELLALPSEE